MKYNIAFNLILSLLFFSSCQDVVDLNVPSGDVQLVVDGWLTDKPGEKEVLLSTTADYFEQMETPRVTGAVVVLFNENGAVDTLAEKGPGQYVTDYTGVPGSTYHLYIRTASGDEYESHPELLKAVSPIDSIYYEYKESTIFTDEGYFVAINTSEPAGEGDYYRWKQFVNGEYLNEPFDLLYASDEFVDGNPILGFEINLDPLEQGDHFRIEQLSISKEAYEFFLILQQQTAFVGSLFDSPPAPIDGNIRNLDPQGKKALGYFGVSGLAEAEILIE